MISSLNGISWFPCSEYRKLIPAAMDDIGGGFSGVVRISNVSDFIAPSQACIIPLKTNHDEAAPSTVGVHAKKEAKDVKPVKVSISLADCLACSGCITSAETVLVEEQNVARALEGLRGCCCSSPASSSTKHHHAEGEEGGEHAKSHPCQTHVGVVSISPASLSSIAASRGIDLPTAARALTDFFVSKGASLVLDANLGEALALEETWREYDERRRKRRGGGEGERIPPLLVSACPGFVCYAEKSHGEMLVPLLMEAKSLQGVMGVLAKEHLPQLLGTKEGDSRAGEGDSSSPAPSPLTIYHVAVMPCFDRKLEAARSDSSISTAAESRHVDCVVGTAELNDALGEFLDERQAKGGDGVAEKDRKRAVEMEERLPRGVSAFMRGDLLGLPGNVSGGYVEFMAERWTEERRGEGKEVTTKRKKMASNLDAVTLSTADGDKLTLAYLYGFRNIQNLVRKLKTGKEVEYDLVEVMACPGGCANGGGQIRAAKADERAALSARVESLYSSLPREDTMSPVSDLLDGLRREIQPDRFRTAFKAMDPAANPAASLNW